MEPATVLRAKLVGEKELADDKRPDFMRLTPGGNNSRTLAGSHSKDIRGARAYRHRDGQTLEQIHRICNAAKGH